MFMVTKTLTITDDAYRILKLNKREGESFSQTIQRVLGAKKNEGFKKLIGLLTPEEGDLLQKDLAMFKKMDIELQEKRFKELWKWKY